MPDASLIDQVAERVERLLVRHAELVRTSTLLREQIAALTHERDNLNSRLLAARARVNALIDRLPANQNGTEPDVAPPQEEGAP